MIGLFGFFYGFMHLMTYVAFESFLSSDDYSRDILNDHLCHRMTAFFLMVPNGDYVPKQDGQRLGRQGLEPFAQLFTSTVWPGVLHYWC